MYDPVASLEEQGGGLEKAAQKELDVLQKISCVPTPAIFLLIQTNDPDASRFLNCGRTYSPQGEEIDIEAAIDSGLCFPYDAWVRLIVGISHHENRLARLGLRAHWRIFEGNFWIRVLKSIVSCWSAKTFSGCTSRTTSLD